MGILSSLDLVLTISFAYAWETRILREPPHPLQAGCWIPLSLLMLFRSTFPRSRSANGPVSREIIQDQYILRYLFFDVCFNFGLLVEFSYDAHVANVRFVVWTTIQGERCHLTARTIRLHELSNRWLRNSQAKTPTSQIRIKKTNHRSFEGVSIEHVFDSVL